MPCAVFVLCSYDLIGYEHQYNSTYVNDDVNDDVNGDNILSPAAPIKDIDLSMMFVRPPLHGVGPDGAALRGDSIEVRRLKRFLRERSLNSEGNDIKILKLRLTHADLLNEIDSFRRLRGSDRSITTTLNNSLTRNTQIMRNLAKMNGAKMWRNLGNEKVKRFVETFTLAGHADPPSKKRNRFGFKGKKDKEELEAEMEQKAKEAAAYVRHQHMISQTRYRACALCEHRFDIRNLTKTVTLKSVWNHRKTFPHPVEMPRNLEGRWDKLYSEVRVCALCAQFFEPDVLKGDEDQEAEREAEAEIYGVETRKRWRSWSMDATQLREKRTEHLLRRNKSVFKKPCGFGGSAVRPSLFGRQDHVMDVASQTAQSVQSRVSSTTAVVTPLPSSTITKLTSSMPTVSPVRIPMVPNVTVPRRPGTAASSTIKGEYLRRGDGAKLNSKQNPRPKSAASRQRVRASLGFGTTSSRILPYRGHNNMVERVQEYRMERIDPMAQARQMEQEQSQAKIYNAEAAKVAAAPRRPSSAGPGTSRRRPHRSYGGGGGSGGGGGGGGGRPRRPMSAAPGGRRRKMNSGRFRRRKSRVVKMKRRKKKKIVKKPEWVDV